MPLHSKPCQSHVSTWDDISLLYCSPEHIPNLCQLKLEVDFDLCGLSDARGLTCILEEHNHHLKSVRLRLIPLRLWLAEWDLGKQAFGNWMAVNISNPVVLSNLESLNLHFLRLWLYGDVFERSAETLTELTLTEAYLRYEQIEIVAKIFSRKHILRSLSSDDAQSANDWSLGYRITKFTRIQVLKLEVSNISGHGEASHGFRDDSQMVTRLLTSVDLIKTDVMHGLRRFSRKRWRGVCIQTGSFMALRLRDRVCSFLWSFYGCGTMS